MINIVNVRRNLLLGLFLLATASAATHFSWHSPVHPPENLVFSNLTAFLLALLDMIGVTYLFSRKKTAAWGYLLNGLLIIYGTVLMTHFGWSAIGGKGSSLFQYLLHPTAPEILIAWADFFAGSVLYRLWFMEPTTKEKTTA